MPSSKKDRVQKIRALYKELEEEIRALQGEFQNLKKRSKGALEGGINRRDTKEIEKIRKSLGL